MSLSACIAAVLACGLFQPARVLAQAPEPADPDALSEVRPANDGPRHSRRLYFGMWTLHLKDDVIALKNNWVIGFSGGGYFGATFVNSFGSRAFTGGIQRTVFGSDRGAFGASLGYRLGFVTGYDGRFGRFARDTPVLPLAQPFLLLNVQRLGFEVSYTFVIVSADVSFRF